MIFKKNLPLRKRGIEGDLKMLDLARDFIALAQPVKSPPAPLHKEGSQ